MTVLHAKFQGRAQIKSALWLFLLMSLLAMFSLQLNNTSKYLWPLSQENYVLTQQQLVDLYQPISQSYFMASYNSYYSSPYFPNDAQALLAQTHTLTSQLNMGVRMLSFNVYQQNNTVLVCRYAPADHCQENSQYLLSKLLMEVKQWLAMNDNDQQVLILHVKRNFVHSQQTLALFKQYLGDLIYPSSTNAQANVCHAIPADLTKAQLLKNNKNILIWSENRFYPTNCAEPWLSLAFSDLGAIKRVSDSEHYSYSSEEIRQGLAAGNTVYSMKQLSPDDQRIEQYRSVN